LWVIAALPFRRNIVKALILCRDNLIHLLILLEYDEQPETTITKKRQLRFMPFSLSLSLVGNVARPKNFPHHEDEERKEEKRNKSGDSHNQATLKTKR
jgi:hypothetical protein